MQPVKGPAQGNPTRTVSNLAVASLVLAIASFVVCPVVGSLAAVIFGHKAKRTIREAAETMYGDGVATAGLVLGYAGFALQTLAFGSILVITLFGANLRHLFAPSP